MPIVYTVRSHDPRTHRIAFRIDLPASPEESAELVLPTWSPGTYEIRESAREVRDLTARESPGGPSLVVDRTEKNRWRIVGTKGKEVEVDYEVYAHDLLDDGLDADAVHLFLNAPRCFPCLEGHRDDPVEVVLHLPAGWSAFAELPRVGEHPPRFRAADYDELVDSPIDCGLPVEVQFRPKGIPHRMLLCSGPGNFDAHRLEEDLPRLVEATIDYFGDSPLKGFTFFTHLSDRRRSGLEHRASTSLIANRQMFRPRSAYEEFLLLCSHEYFHVYNVKRIHPKVLERPDLTRETYTRLLWLMEGTTDYVATLLLRYAGLDTASRTREKIATHVRNYRQGPGRLVRSLEEASLVCWIDLYRPYEESRNQSVSYYTKGTLVSWCLDLEILHRTGTERSLQTVLRHLWTEYGKTGRGIEEEEAQAIFERATGLDLGSFFDRYIRGTQEVDFAAFARLAGLSCEPVAPKEEPEKPIPGYLGVEFAPERGELRIREVLDGTPARKAGISPDDEIVAIDGIRVNASGFGDALARLPPGSATEITLFRRRVLTSVRLTTASPPPEKYRIEPLEVAGPLERKVYEAWLRSPWEPSKPGAPNGSGLTRG
ncbi:MAG: PDZ domain-containing protein [Thermoplasmata archaeon]|nr:PDZ domain-containing protein [Thermoplasmata archaeon]